jgi:hypothetical protein
MAHDICGKRDAWACSRRGRAMVHGTRLFVQTEADATLEQLAEIRSDTLTAIPSAGHARLPTSNAQTTTIRFEASNVSIAIEMNR